MHEKRSTKHIHMPNFMDLKWLMSSVHFCTVWCSGGHHSQEWERCFI